MYVYLGKKICLFKFRKVENIVIYWKWREFFFFNFVEIFYWYKGFFYIGKYFFVFSSWVLFVNWLFGNSVNKLRFFLWFLI